MKGRRDEFNLDGTTARKLQMIRLFCQNLSTSQVHQSPITIHQSPIPTHNSPLTHNIDTKRRCFVLLKSELPGYYR